MAEIGSTQGSSGTISYPTDTMREVAQDILTAVQAARQDHTTAWNAIEHYMNVTCAPSYKPFGITPQLGWPGNSVSSTMQGVLEPHAQRLSASYDWLESFAQTLIDAANAMDQMDQAIVRSFQ